MNKQLSFALILIFLSACSDKKQIEEKHFDTFEISYNDSWVTRYSILIDSNKNYFERSASFDGYFANGIVKGKLADSTFEIINELVYRIKTDTSIQSREFSCYDCPKMAIRISSNNNLFQLHQTGKIDTTFDNLINILSNLTPSNGKMIFDTIIEYNTTYWVAPTPPLKPPVKFQKPKNK